MFKIIDAICNLDLTTTCEVCKQHLDLLNNPAVDYKVKPLYAKNLNTHLHFSHGMGCEVVEVS